MADNDNEELEQSAVLPADPNDSDDADDDDEDDNEDFIDDLRSALRNARPRKRVPNGEYGVIVSSIKYTEMPFQQGPSYLTLNLLVQRGPYKGKVIPFRINALV